MKINERKVTTGSHEAKKVDGAKTPAAPETKSGPMRLTTQQTGFSTGGANPDTSPVGVKSQVQVTATLSLEAIPYDPDVNMGKWADKHLDDAAVRTKDVKEVGDSKPVQQTKLLMCPVLGSLVKEGSLKPDENGNVSLKQFNDVMINRLGITPERAAVTVSTATIGNHLSDLWSVLKGQMNLNHLAGSFLDHTGRGDTAILKGGVFNEDMFKALISHSDDGKTMTVEDFGEAIKQQLKRDAGVATYAKGTSEDLFEMAALINTFGYTDEKGVRRIDFETLRNLYEKQELPPKEVLMARKPTGVLEHLATMAKMTTGLD